MWRIGCVWLCAVLTALAAADAGGRAEYVGGTLGHLPAGLAGRLHISGQESLLFEVKGQAIQVPYEQINLLEYGQQTGRRYLLALTISPILLLSKARKHFLSVGYKDEEGRQQVMVFRIHKSDVRAVLASLEARTGLKVDFQDDEARKAGGG